MKRIEVEKGSSGFSCLEHNGCAYREDCSQALENVYGFVPNTFYEDPDIYCDTFTTGTNRGKSVYRYQIFKALPRLPDLYFMESLIKESESLEENPCK